MNTYLRCNNSKNLIVFFCGWAMDEKPFMPLKSEKYDILFVFDYADLELDFDFSKYEKKILIAFSYGVFVAAIAKLPEFDLKIAVNGTLKPIDSKFGISPKIFDLTLCNMSDESLLKFYSRMFDNNVESEMFNQNLPVRAVDSCLKELEAIKNHYFNTADIDFEYDKTIISSNDKIIPTKNQLAFWEGKNLKEFNAGHFIFYKFKNFDEIMEL